MQCCSFLHPSQNISPNVIYGCLQLDIACRYWLAVLQPYAVITRVYTPWSAYHPRQALPGRWLAWCWPGLRTWCEKGCIEIHLGTVTLLFCRIRFEYLARRALKIQARRDSVTESCGWAFVMTVASSRHHDSFCTHEVEREVKYPVVGLNGKHVASLPVSSLPKKTTSNHAVPTKWVLQKSSLKQSSSPLCYSSLSPQWSSGLSRGIGNARRKTRISKTADSYLLL